MSNSSPIFSPYIFLGLDPSPPPLMRRSSSPVPHPRVFLERGFYYFVFVWPRWFLPFYVPWFLTRVQMHLEGSKVPRTYFSIRNVRHLVEILSRKVISVLDSWSEHPRFKKKTIELYWRIRGCFQANWKKQFLQIFSEGRPIKERVEVVPGPRRFLPLADMPSDFGPLSLCPRNLCAQSSTAQNSAYFSI